MPATPAAADPAAPDLAAPDLAERLRARGLRLTSQREQVLAAVRRLGHATPDQISETVPGVDVASVLVREVDASGAPVAGSTTRLVWSVRLTTDAQDGTVDGLVASLSPTPLRSAGTEITLREGLRTGLD